jgi:hypothetical protein
LKILRIKCEEKYNLPELSEHSKVLKGKFIAVNTYIKKSNRSQINNLMVLLKVLEKEKQENLKLVNAKKQLIS